MHVLSDIYEHDRHARVLADRRDALLGEIGVLKRLIQDVFAYRRAFVSPVFLKPAPHIGRYDAAGSLQSSLTVLETDWLKLLSSVLPH